MTNNVLLFITCTSSKLLYNRSGTMDCEMSLISVSLLHCFSSSTTVIFLSRITNISTSQQIYNIVKICLLSLRVINIYNQYKYNLQPNNTHFAELTSVEI